MSDHVYWWLQFLKLFALNTPFGMPVKFTIGVSAYDGERLAEAWKMKPYDVVDAYGRACRQIKTDDKLIALEWLVLPKVHAILRGNSRQRAADTRAQTPALLKGLIFGPTGCALTPTHTRKGGRLYRYYIATDLLKHDAAACTVRRVPAAEIEGAVVDQVRGLLRAPEMIVRTWRAGKRLIAGLTEAEVREALQRLDPVWKPEEKPLYFG